MNTFFITNDEIKIRRYDKNTHMDMIIPVDINQTNKSYLLHSNQEMHVNWNFI